MKYALLLMLVLACAAEEPTTVAVVDVESAGGESDHRQTSGREAATETDRDEVDPIDDGAVVADERGQGGGGTGMGTLQLGTIGRGGGPARVPPPEEVAAARARRSAAHAAAEAEYQARCASIALTPGLPPRPPAAPSTPALDALRPAYRASLASAFARPTDNSTAGINTWMHSVFTTWLRETMARLQAFSQQAGNVPASDGAYARAWIAHTYAVFVERFHAAPVPREVATDPELRVIYSGAIANQTAPLLAQSGEALSGLVLPGPWSTWKAETTTWLTQEACAFH